MRKSAKAGMIVLSFAVLAAVVWMANPGRIWQTMQAADLAFVLAAFAVSFSCMVLRVLKWSVLIGVPVRRLFDVQILGLTISNFTPGKLAEPIKLILLKKTEKIDVSSSLGTIIWERINDVTVMIILSLVALASLASLVNEQVAALAFAGLAIFAGIVIVAFVILASERGGTKLFKVLRRLPLLNRVSEEFIRNFYKTKTSKTKVVKSLIITAVPWILEGVTMILILNSIGVAGFNSAWGVIMLAGIVSLAVIVGVASTLPGGIGGTELVMILLLGVAGVGEAGAAVIMFRFATFWFGAAVGGLSLARLSRRGIRIS